MPLTQLGKNDLFKDQISKNLRGKKNESKEVAREYLREVLMKKNDSNLGHIKNDEELMEISLHTKGFINQMKYRCMLLMVNSALIENNFPGNTSFHPILNCPKLYPTYMMMGLWL